MKWTSITLLVVAILVVTGSSILKLQRKNVEIVTPNLFDNSPSPAPGNFRIQSDVSHTGANGRFPARYGDIVVDVPADGSWSKPIEINGARYRTSDGSYTGPYTHPHLVHSYGQPALYAAVYDPVDSSPIYIINVNSDSDEEAANAEIERLPFKHRQSGGSYARFRTTNPKGAAVRVYWLRIDLAKTETVRHQKYPAPAVVPPSTRSEQRRPIEFER